MCLKDARYKLADHWLLITHEKPPSDKEIKEMLESMEFCAECNYKFTDFDYTNQLKANKEFLLCEDCMKNNQRQYKEKDFIKVRIFFGRFYLTEIFKK